jgi:hypothetical protein
MLPPESSNQDLLNLGHAIGGIARAADCEDAYRANTRVLEQLMEPLHPADRTQVEMRLKRFEDVGETNPTVYTGPPLRDCDREYLDEYFANRRAQNKRKQDKTTGKQILYNTETWLYDTVRSRERDERLMGCSHREIVRRLREKGLVDEFEHNSLFPNDPIENY